MTESDRLDRRSFLKAGGAAIGAATATNLFAEDKKADPFAGFMLGVQSYTFREFDLEGCLKRTQGLGLHYAELYQKHAPINASADQLKAILTLCKDYEITPVCWGVQSFGKNHDQNKKVFDFGKALGIKSFSADPDPESFDSLDKLCEEYKIAIAIHPHGPAGNKLHRWYSAEIILDAVKSHHPLIGSCLDTGHLIRSAQPPFNKKLVPEDQVRVMGARNFGLHLKDHDNEKRHDVIFGQGVLNVAAVLKALREVKFKGHLSIEYEHNAKEPTADVKACVEVFKDAAKTIG
jgi:sugar phosphate isomerase/epimerase